MLDEWLEYDTIYVGENGQNYQFFVFCLKSVFRYGGIASQIFKGLSALEPPKIGGKGGPEGVQIWLFSLFIFIIYSFIYLMHSYFSILLVCDKC